MVLAGAGADSRYGPASGTTTTDYYLPGYKGGGGPRQYLDQHGGIILGTS